jgi:phosphoribosylformylglycinamidine synthase subunit PurSL
MSAGSSDFGTGPSGSSQHSAAGGAAAMQTAPAGTIERFEVRMRSGQIDPAGAAARKELAAIGVQTPRVRVSRIYLIQRRVGTPFNERQRTLIQSELLGDSVTEQVFPGASAPLAGHGMIEVFPLPGVMDPVGQTVSEALLSMLGEEVEVISGTRYEMEGLSSQQAEAAGKKLFANTVIQRVQTVPYMPARFPVGALHTAEIREIPLRGLSDEQLAKLSRSAHLFLSLDEMKAIQSHYAALGREPREIELETLAQTWSEHCVHKTLKSSVHYTSDTRSDTINWQGRPGVVVQSDGTVRMGNLLKHTVAAATFELVESGIDWTLSVFKDNSGVIALDEQWGVNIKVETHNRPSAIEPYGGAATGIGGCIRDVVGTGLGAKPIANTNVFCVADPLAQAERLPPGVLHPRRILTQVVAGVRDYGNRMGIPTVNGCVLFDNRYVGNPLVFAGCIGLIPRHLVHGKASAGDLIVAIGGRTGRDGVHGATFSSAQLEQNAADEFSHAVQIGNAVTEKQALDAIMRARDHASGKPLFSGMTDCGAGGFSSAVGEMGSSLGAMVHLERAPLKYPGLSPTEIWISEAQERMVLSVPPQNFAELQRICEEEGVDCCELGTFGTPNQELILSYQGTEVGRLSMHLLHEGIPMPTRVASWPPSPEALASKEPPVLRERSIAERMTLEDAGPGRVHVKDALLALLSHPNIASKHWIIRQYDHEVQGNTVIKPLVGPTMSGPSDAAVIEPIAGSNRGIALACGLHTASGDPLLKGDPYQMALLGIDEAVRNLVCTGADATRIAILDNFCWPSCDKPHNMGALVRACLGCYDGAKAYRTPFVSGKDSLNNQLSYTDPVSGQQRLIEIPYTLLITGMAIVPSIKEVITMDAKQGEHVLLLVGPRQDALGGSHYQSLFGDRTLAGSKSSSINSAIPKVDLAMGPKVARAVSELIALPGKHVLAAHDVSDGGLACCVAEMILAGNAPGKPVGASMDLSGLGISIEAALFAEAPSQYVLQVANSQLPMVMSHLAKLGIPVAPIGVTNTSGMLTIESVGLSCVTGDLHGAWRSPLNW